MHVERLKIICDLAETECFTKAAQLNNLTQSAVSQHILRLERQFKSRFFERSRKKCRLTREGQALYEHSRQIIRICNLLNNRIQEIRDISSRTVRVATICSIGLHELPSPLKKFLELFPTLHVQVEFRPTDQVYDDLLENVADLGLVAYPVKNIELEIMPLRKDILVMICHPKHPLARSRSAKLSQLAGEKFISFEQDIPTRNAVDNILKRHDVEVGSVMELDNIESVKRAVEIEAGISIVPQGTITQEVSMHTLAEVRIEGVDTFRPLAAIYKKDKALSPAMKQFLHVLKG
jgi:DNA-binding transcriptional LysR family regulator